jgi:serine/threonine protein kinase
MCIASIVFIQYAKAAARDVNNYTDSNSDEYAKAESIVLPNFVRVLYWQAVTSLVSGIVVLTVTINPSSENGKLAAGCFALIWAFQHGVVEGTAFLLQQKGCGEYAAMIARTITFCFFWVVFFFNFMVFRFGRRAYVFQMLLDVFLLTYFGVMWLAPQIHVHRRPALIFYSKFWFFFRGLVMILHILYVFDSIHSYISCTFYLYRVLSFAVFQPVLLYKAFLLDSLYWQGIVAGGEKDISRMTMQESNVPLGTALYLAQALDNMKLTSNAKLLNFAFLDFEKETLGQGSFSVVVLGHYKKEPVAIKKIRTQDLTIEVIQRIVAEATILSSMKDPNVVGIYGVSILPPSICIVLEACKYGSLGDVIRGVGNIEQPKYYTPPLNINIYDKLYLALGCAKGLAAVHAFSPNLSHRDVKSYNFLVDYQMNVKIADLELGDGAEELPNPYWMCDISKCDPCALFSKSKEVVDNEDVSPDAPMPEVHPSMVNMQAMWLAPEVLRSGEFKQSADVFSLAIVLWEIRTSKFPYEHCKFFQRQIRECILQGYRHPFPDASMDPQRARTMKAYDDLVQAAWSEDPDQRPTAAVIAKSLEKILNECCYEIMLSKPISNYVESIAAVGDCFDFPDLSSNADNGSSELGLVDEPAFPVRQTISRDGVAACCNNLDIECGAWLVVSLEPPFNIMHVTRAFCSEFSSQSQFLSRKTASLTDVLVELGFELPAPSAPTRIKSVSAVEMMRSFVNGVLLNLKSRSYEHLLLLLIDDDSFSDYSVHFYFVDTSVIDSDKKSPSATKSSGFVAILFSNLLADRNQHRRTLKDLQDAENQGIVNGAVNALRASASVDKNRTISSSRAISRDQAKIHTKGTLLHSIQLSDQV